MALQPVKTRIREIAALLVIDRLRADVGLSGGAAVAAHELHRQPGHRQDDRGAADGGDPAPARLRRDAARGTSVTRDDLVGQYVGHTAPKTKEVLKRAYGGVLFIDEAYYLHRPDNERDYGQEAIEILLQVMEAERDRLVVILAGYKDQIEAFFRSNPGMGSRVAHHIDFPDYSVDELIAIARLMLEQREYELGPDAETALYGYVERRMRQPRFANARSIRNAIDRARLRQAGRLFERAGPLSRADLATIEAEDVLRSSVFKAGGPRDPSHHPRRGRRLGRRQDHAHARAGAAARRGAASRTSPPTTTTATTASSAPSAA